MKLTIIGLALLAAGVIFSAEAQAGDIPNLLGPVSTNPPVLATPPATSGVSNFWGVVTYVGGYAWDTLKQLDFSQGFEAQPFGFYVANGNWGGGVEANDIDTNNFIHLGFLVGGVNEKQLNADGTTTRNTTWYCGSTSVSVSGTLNQALGASIPIIGNFLVTPEAGPLVDLSNGSVYFQAFTKAGKRWDLGKGWMAGIDAGPGYISKYGQTISIVINGAISKRF